MDAKATELRAEQAYVDHAYECLEEMRRQVAEAHGGTVVAERAEGGGTRMRFRLNGRPISS